MLQHLQKLQKEKKARWDTQYNTWNGRTIEVQKGISVVLERKLYCNCHQKTKDLADNEADINACDDGDVDEFDTSSQIVEQMDMLNESIGIICITLKNPCCG